jgi:two-component system response regulator BaeR
VHELPHHVVAKFETGMPLVLTSSQEDHFQGLLPNDLPQIAPKSYADRIKRRGIVYAWMFDAYRKAVDATGKKKLIMTGLTNDICIDFPAISAVEAGFEVQVVFDGVGVCSAVRRFSVVPILMLTARVDGVDKLLGLDTGADGSVCKPFSPREVMARVRALVRRYHGRLGAVPFWQVDEYSLRISWRGSWLTLTPVEFRLLRALLTHPGRVYSRSQLLDVAHADATDVSDRTIDSHIKNLRRKIQSVEPGAEAIASVYGLGYRLDAPEM